MAIVAGAGTIVADETAGVCGGRRVANVEMLLHARRATGFYTLAYGYYDEGYPQIQFPLIFDS